LRVDEIDEDTLEPAGDQIRRAFANRERLRGEELPDGRLSRAMPLRLEAEIGRKRADVVLDGGTRSILPTSRTAADVLERLDGKRTLRSLAADTATVRLCRELLELGALRI